MKTKHILCVFSQGAAAVRYRQRPDQPEPHKEGACSWGEGQEAGLQVARPGRIQQLWKCW